MAEYKIPYQNLTFQIPSDGEVYISDPSSPQAVYVRKGDTIFSVSTQSLGEQFLKSQGKQLNASGWANMAEGINYLKQLGIDVKKLPVYNAGDVGTAFNRKSGVITLGNIDLLKSTPKNTEEVITKTVSPTNPNAAFNVSSVTGAEVSNAPTYSQAGAITPPSNFSNFVNPNKDIFNQPSSNTPAGTTTPPSGTTSAPTSGTTGGTTSAPTSGTTTPTSGTTGTPTTITPGYGREQNSDWEGDAKTEFGFITKAATGMVKPEFLSQILSEPGTVSFFVNALAYGGYQIGDVLNEIKRMEMVKDGDTKASAFKIIDPEIDRTAYLNTADGQKAQREAATVLPTFQLAGNMNPEILKYGLNITLLTVSCIK